MLVPSHAQSFNHFNKNMYSTREDVRRYPYVPPIVSAGDYSRHPWLGAFSPTQSETFTEALTALKQSQTLARVRKYGPENHTHAGLWDGEKTQKYRIFRTNFKSVTMWSHGVPKCWSCRKGRWVRNFHLLRKPPHSIQIINLHYNWLQKFSQPQRPGRRSRSPAGCGGLPRIIA